MRYSVIFKRQSFIIVVSIIGISLILLGASYALFMSNHQGSDQTLSAGTLSATFSGSTVLSTDLVPLTDEEALASETNVYTFSLNNTGSLAMEYKLTLANSLDGVNDNNMIAHKYVKVKFDDNEPIYLDKLTKLDDSKTNENEIVYILNSSVINSGVGNEVHTIRIWISDVDSSGAETEESIIGKIVAFKIGLEGNATDSESITLANYIMNKLYVEDGINDLYYHDGKGMYDNADQEAGDNSYRYSGSNPNNYLCFGNMSCTDNDLYRIIGVFEGRVKVIKSLSYGRYQWDNLDKNDWAASSLNLNVLNNTFLNSFDNSWQNKISNNDWIVEGNLWNVISVSTAKSVYNNELKMDNPKKFTSKIGLLYLSDYAYASSPTNWKTEMYNYNNQSNVKNNWIFNSDYEWLITNNTAESNQIFAIVNDGAINYYNSAGTGCSVRPVFYLENDVVLTSGSGTLNNPFIIQ